MSGDPASSPRGPLVLEQFLPYRLHAVAARLSEMLSKVYTDYGISTHQWRVLAHLGEHERLTSKQISAYSGLDKTRISRVINDLHDRGWLRKTPHDSDNRATYLSLTSAGRAQYEQLAPRALACEDEMLAALDLREYRELIRIIDKLEQHINASSTKHEVSN